MEDQEKPPKWEQELKDPPETPPAKPAKKPAAKAKAKEPPKPTDDKKVAKPEGAEGNEKPKKTKPKPAPNLEEDDEILPI